MASVRGNLNIQFLIELSSENLFNIVVDCTRTRAQTRVYASFVTGLAAWDFDFCRAIAMIAKLNERNTFVVSNPARKGFAGARGGGAAARAVKVEIRHDRPEISEDGTEPCEEACALESERRTHPEMSCAFHRTRQLRLLRTVRGAGGWDSLHRS